MNALETRTVNGFTVELYHDDDPGSPRDWTHGCEMVMFHKRYDLPNDAGVSASMFEGWAEVAEYLGTEEQAILVLPVFMIDHSGIAFRVGRDFEDVDPGSWDSGQVGFAYVTPQNWTDCQGESHPWTGSQENWETARDMITSDVATYSQYAEGDVYGYVITDPIDGEDVESQWGCYGYDYAWEEAEAAANAAEHKVKCNGTLNRITGEVEHSESCPVHPGPCPECGSVPVVTRYEDGRPPVWGPACGHPDADSYEVISNEKAEQIQAAFSAEAQAAEEGLLPFVIIPEARECDD